MRIQSAGRPIDERVAAPSGGRVSHQHWRRPLVRARRAVNAMFRLVDSSERLADDAERLIARRRRPHQARHCLHRAYNGLSSASRRLGGWSRGLEASFACLMQDPEQWDGTPQVVITAAFMDSLAAAERLATVSNRVDAIMQQYRDVTVSVPGGGVVAAVQRRYIPVDRHPAAGDLRPVRLQPPVSTLAKGSQIFRGRAPPRFMDRTSQSRSC